MDTVALASTWIHAISIVTLLGYYATLSLVVLPWLTSGGSPEPGRAIAALERRAFPWIIASIAAFAASGVLLMFTSPKYEGFGNLASSSWATLIVVKHVVVIAMVAVGVVLDRVLIARVDGTWWTPPAEPSREVRDLRPVAQASWAMVLLGAVVLLLTAAAQLA